MGEEKKGEDEARAISKRELLRDLNYLSKKGLVSGHEVYYLIKNFLRSYLRLNYEFTKDELFAELKNIYLPYNIRSDFFKFIERIFMFEYSQVTYTDQELRDILDDFRGYLDYLFITNQARAVTMGQVVAKKWTQKLSELIFGKRRKDLMSEEQPESKNLSLQIISGTKANHIELNSLIEKVYYSIYNSDMDSALQLYQKVVSLYNELKPDERVNYYDTLQSVYNSIKNSSISS